MTLDESPYVVGVAAVALGDALALAFGVADVLALGVADVLAFAVEVAAGSDALASRSDCALVDALALA
ncbi:MAG: hypothetical protein ACRDN1_00720, partial [Trebonia sp.]